MKDELKAREMSDCYTSSQPTTRLGDKARQNSSATPKKQQSGPSPPTQATLTNQSKTVIQCCFCKEAHYADKCAKVTTVAERKSILQGESKCFKCLGNGHSARKCNGERKCFYCKENTHHSCLCPAKFSGDSSKSTGSQLISNSKTSPGNKSRSPGATNKDTTLLVSGSEIQMMMAKVEIRHKDDIIPVRVFIDSGSTRSYITTALRHKLNLPMDSEEIISVGKFANRRRKTVCYKKASIDIPVIDGSAVQVATLVTDVITCPILKYPVDISSDPILTKVLLADPPTDKLERVDIDILIGLDYYHKFVGMEKIELSNGMILMQSRFGHIVSGPVPVNDAIEASSVTLLCHDAKASDNSIERLWRLEDVGVKDDPYKEDDELAQSMFEDTVRITNGRYEVTWPWKCGKNADPDLPTNYGLALGRLSSLMKRLKDSDPAVLELYDKTIQDQLINDIIEEVAVGSSDAKRVHYIPHHCVIRENKATTKLRIVYDASAKSSKHHQSLNDSMHRGPIILEDLCGMLLRFRLPRIAMVSDVEKAFLQVGLQPIDRDVTRFLWLKDPNQPVSAHNLRIFRFKRIPFGVVNSPFLLEAVIKHHLAKQNSEIAGDISDNLYVDNVLAGRPDLTTAIEYYSESKRLFSEISMNIREWYSKSTEFTEQLPEKDKGVDKLPKVLGMKWDTSTDTISCEMNNNSNETKSKRQLLQCVSKVYDPCGLFSPVVISGKMLVQEAWRQQIPWDKELPEDIQVQFQTVKSSLSEIGNIKVPRVPTMLNGNSTVRLELHCFCDASERAYAAACYLRSVNSNGTSSSGLIFSKARLAPLKQMSIPRLELMAVVVGCRMTKFVKKELRVNISKCYVWTDSKCVLLWIDSTKTLPVFVANRIKEIKSNSEFVFRHVPTTCNPADIPSRATDIDTLRVSTLWWQGPQFLKVSEDIWPEAKPHEKKSEESNADTDQSSVESEAVTMIADQDEICGIGNIINVNNYSSLSRLLRVTAYVMKFIKICKNRSKSQIQNCHHLENDDIAGAERQWVKYIQKTAYPDCLNHKQFATMVQKLGLFKDDCDIMRCSGRFEAADLLEESRQPKLLPKSNHFTDLVIERCHRKLYHSGVRQTLAQVRMEYWIPSGTSQVKRVLHRCITCRKIDSGPFKVPESPPLPWFRVSKSHPFQYVGVDYLGHFFIKDNDVTKVWIALFTCATTRAIHLEVITDMSAEQFLLCLRRFSATYGAPSIIVSDNAKHFKTTNALFNMISKDSSIQDYSSSEGVTWRFITELAPWMGGFYERLVRSVKQAFRKTLGKRCISLVEFQTIVAEISAIINSRPLIATDADVNEPILSPLHFLSRRGRIGLPHFEVDPADNFINSQKSMTGQRLLETWIAGQRILDNFWKIWQNEYMAPLRERCPPRLNVRNSSDISPRQGVVVLVKEPLPRSQWKLGRIDNVLVGNDGKFRSAIVRLPSGKRITRAIRSLYPLEDSLQEESTSPASTNNNKHRPVRRAAQIAQSRIKHQMHDVEFSDSE